MFRNKLFSLIPVLSFGLGLSGIANAASNIYPLVGAPRLINATGQTIDSEGDTGGIGLSGLITFNNSGGASSVNLTITYEDNDFVLATGANPDVFTCLLTSPSDVTYNLTPSQTGVGTSTSGALTISVGPDDLCTQTGTGTSFSNNGNFLSFNLYVYIPASLQINGRIAETFSNLADPSAAQIAGASLTGTLQ